jgi:hypothetical protein
MNPASHESLGQLAALGTSSLLQYIAQAGTWAAPAAQDTLAAVLLLADEEREATSRFVRFLQKNRFRLPPLGFFPSQFTTMNFVGVEYLVPVLIKEHVKEIGAIERLLARMDDEQIRAMTQAYLEMKRRHLRTLEEQAPAAAPTPAGHP